MDACGRKRRHGRFAKRREAELGLPARAVPGSRTADSDVGIVVLATSSGEPVVEAGWIRPDAM